MNLLQFLFMNRTKENEFRIFLNELTPIFPYAAKSTSIEPPLGHENSNSLSTQATFCDFNAMP